MSTAAAYTADSVLAGEKNHFGGFTHHGGGRFVGKESHSVSKTEVSNFPKRNSPGERDGGWDPKARISEMEVDGVSAEVLYPTLGLRLFALEDAELQEACFQIANGLDDRLLQSDTGALDRHPDDLAYNIQQCHQGARALQRRRG